MADDERGGFFGFGNQWWIWIVIIIVVIIVLCPGIFDGRLGYYKD